MSNKKFAVIGCGRIGARHAGHIHTLGELNAVCDTDEKAGKTLAEKYGAKFYASADELLKKEKSADVISVCTPNNLHAPQTISALNAGFHVICEKPMAISVADCRKMTDASEQTGKYLFIVKQNRFNPPIEALKKVIDGNHLGKIVDVQLNCFWNRDEKYYSESPWKGKKEKDGGTLFTQFSHFIDLLYWLVGDIKNVWAKSNNFLHQDTVEFEDTGVVILEFQNGALGTINYTINCYEKNMEGSVTILGEDGTVKVGGQYLNVLEYQRIKDYRIENLPESRPANEYGFYQGSMSNHDKVYQNVIDVLDGKSKNYTTGYEGMKTVEIIEKIYAKMKSAR